METWNLQQLSERTEREMERIGMSHPGGRVSPVPNARTIRYYTTLGLVDKPSAYAGGVAQYGERHLLQLLAIKKLQAEFLPLPQIQKRLLGCSDEELRRMVEQAAALVSETPAAPRAATWIAHPVVPGVTLVVQDPQLFREWAQQPQAAVELSRSLAQGARELLRHSREA